MADIAIVASGTQGDVQPYVALGRGLRGAGHTVRLLTSDNFADLATRADLAFGSIGSSIEDLLQSDAWRRTIEGGNFLAILAKMRAEMRQRAADSARPLRDLLTGADLLLTGVAGLGGAFAVAETLRIPVIQAYVFPFTPTRAFPSPLTPSLPLGDALNRLSFGAMRQMLWQSTRVGDVATRRELGVGKGSLLGPLGALARTQAPVLYGYSTHVLPCPDDWPATHHVTGYWFLDAEPDWAPPPDLAAFLAAGAPPVYIGFGSMGSRDPREAGRIALEALERSGQRGVLAAGWGGLTSSDLPATVYPMAELPHSWLFPRMAAVVHHGGAGTTAAALRAGVPATIVPFMGDQPFWGRRVAALGVGTAPIPRKRLTVGRLAEAIAESVATGAMRERAGALGRDIRAEDGVGRAVAVVDGFVRRGMAVPHSRGRALRDED